MMWIIITGVGLGIALFGLHHLALWAERRGWIFYKNARGSLGPYGQALIQATSMFAPEVEHVIEQQQAEKLRADQAESGDPSDEEHHLPGSVEIY